jgi:DNA-binding CsgD family transcriptional regulator
MNVTNRTKVKDEMKVLAWGNHQSVKNAIMSITEKYRVKNRKKYAMDASK